MKGYPRFFPRVVFGVVALAVVSGGLLIPGALTSRFDVIDAPAWLTPRRALVAAIHVGAGGVVLAILGALWPIHMRAGWRRGRNVRSGITTVLLPLALALSGLGLLYAGGEATGRLAAGAHLAAGLLFPALMLVHVLRARKTRHQG